MIPESGSGEGRASMLGSSPFVRPASGRHHKWRRDPLLELAADLASKGPALYSVARTPSVSLSNLLASTEAAEITGLSTGPKGGA